MHTKTQTHTHTIDMRRHAHAHVRGAPSELSSVRVHSANAPLVTGRAGSSLGSIRPVVQRHVLNMYVYMCVCACIHIYIYIYIHICI